MPTTLATCQVYGTIFDVFGEPVEGAVVGCMAVYKNGALVLSRTLEVQTDIDGYFTIDLPRGPNCIAILYANTPGLNISALGTPTAIPDADSAELVSIIGDYDLWSEVPVAVPIGAGVSTFNGRDGDVVLLASDVTGALGYTPADAAALAGYLPLAGGFLTGPLVLNADPVALAQAATKRYVDNSIAAIPPSGANPAGTGTELQYRLNATTLGAIPSDVSGGNVHFHGSLDVDGYYGMRSTSAGTYMRVTEPGVTAVSVFYAINTTGNPRYIYFGRGNRFDIYTPQYISFYTGAVGTEDVRRMYLSPVGSLVVNVQALADQAAALTVNAAGNNTFPLAFIANGASHLNGATTLGAGASLSITFASGYTSQIARQDAAGYYYSGPVNADANGATGLYVLHCCGTGGYEGAPGTVNQHGPNATWYYSAHIQQSAGYFLTLGQDPTAANHAATKAYVDAHTGGGGGVDLAADYPWTGTHSWTKDAKIITPTNGGGLFMQSGAAGLSPTVNFSDEAGAGLASLGVARTVGAFMQPAQVNDVCLMNYFGHTFIHSRSGNVYVALGGYGAEIYPLIAHGGGVQMGPRVGINGAVDSGSRLYVTTTGYPEFALAFTNGTDSSVNLQVAAAGTATGSAGRGRGYLTSFGDFVLASYTGLAEPDWLIACYGPGSPAGGRAVVVYTYPETAWGFAVGPIAGGINFSVSNSGDVTLAHDPTAPLHAATKAYVDSVLSAFAQRNGLKV